MTFPDLTRWNRAGLDQMRYVDGNAATFLETFRLELVKAFRDPVPDPAAKPWPALVADIPEQESEDERLERILKAYQGARGDWSMEISRAFARAMHIIGESANAYANEGYLRTATQWDSLRRLGAMIDYVPAPASSAETALVLLAEIGITDEKVRAGFAVKSEPADGSAPVVFETLEDISIASALNALRIANYDHNPLPFGDPGGAFASLPGDADTLPLWPLSDDSEASAGQPAILLDLGPAPAAPLAVRIHEVSEDGSGLAIAAPDGGDADARARAVGDARLTLAPAIILTPRLNGPDVVRVSGSHGLATGEAIAWTAGDNRHFARVADVDTGRLQLSGHAELPAPGTRLYRARSISRAQFSAAGSKWVLPLDSDLPKSDAFTFTYVRPDGSFAAPQVLDETTSEEFRFDQPGAAASQPSGIRIKASAVSGAREILFFDVGRDDSPTRVISNLADALIEVDGSARGLAGGQHVALEGPDGDLEAARILYVRAGSERSYVRLSRAPGLEVITALHAGFAERIAPTGFDRDPEPVGTLTLALDTRDMADWPRRLSPGRRVVLESESGVLDAVTTLIVGTDPQRGEITLEGDGSLLDGFTNGDLIVRANAVLAGHGESKPGKVAGSGDAARISQTFSLDIDELTHVSDPAFPGGVRAAVAVEIEGEIWTQVPSLRDVPGSAAAYVARLDADGMLRLTFGDGFRGRRLPTGRNNVLVLYRKGAGLAGNLPPHGLSKIVNAHAAVSGVRQPVAASGGDGREALEAIRETAPERLAALDRAVSLPDFEALARAVQGIWHAAAREMPLRPGRRSGVIVTLVPAGGGDLGAAGDRVAATLSSRAIPGVDIALEPYEPVALEARLDLAVNSDAFDPTEVADAVRLALEETFHLRRRAPGQPIYRSEIYAVAETTPGVTNAVVTLFPSLAPEDPHDFERVARGDDDGIWSIRPARAQVIHALDPGALVLTTVEATI